MKTGKKYLFIFLVASIILPSYGVAQAKSDSTDRKEGVLHIDSISLNRSKAFNVHYSGNWFYKIGDSLKWATDTNTLAWRKSEESNVSKSAAGGIVKITEKYTSIDGEYRGNIWYMVPIQVAPSQLNQPVCIYYDCDAAIEVFLNGRLMARKGYVSSNMDDEYIVHANGYFYATFNKPHNYLTFRASNHHIVSGFVDISFSVCSDKRQQQDMESSSIADTIDIAVSIFYLAFFFVYLNLFFSDRRVKANLYFSIFCFFIALVFFTSAKVAQTENYKLNSLGDTISMLNFAYLSYAFICFLHQLVYGSLKRYLRWILLICIALTAAIILTTLFEHKLLKILCYVVLMFVGLFGLIDAVRVVVIGLERKIKGIKPIIFGVLTSAILLLICVILTTTLANNLSDFKVHILHFSFAFSIAVIPISVSITLVNNYASTSKQLAIELVNVSELSEKTIKQEKEKQQILESQNEKLEEQVTVRTAEVVRQKNEIEQQKHLIEEHQKDIIDSITYAKRIQDAILPPISLIEKYLSESFVLYKPKDIVAGDFYWMEKSGDTILIAAADCTGHGVPGALVSVLCSNALNRTVKEFKINEPGKILDKVRELVLETFEKSEDNVQDGMDISLCCINTNTEEVQWSGAYNSLWYIQKGELHEVPADKQPIGKFEGQRPFSTYSLKLSKGDILYLFTDGYADQFGGSKGKKFKYKQLQDILLATANRHLAEQKNILEKTLENWKGDLEQVDDILIIGIKV